MRNACWITKATHILRILLYQCNNGCKNTPQCNDIRTLPRLFIQQCSLRLPKFLSTITTMKFLSTITTIRRFNTCFTTICPYLYHIPNVTSNFLQLRGPAAALSRKCLPDDRAALQKFSAIRIIRTL